MNLSTPAPRAAVSPNVLRIGAARTIDLGDVRIHVGPLGGGWRAAVLLAAPDATDHTAGHWTAACAPLLTDDVALPGASRVLKDGAHAQVIETRLRVGDVTHTVVCKSSRPSGWRRRLSSAWNGPKEYREFWTGHRLLQAGLRTPRPLACIWRPLSPVGFAARLLTPLLTGACGLDEVAVRLAAPSCPTAVRRAAVARLAAELAALLNGLGDHGLYHRDLKASNIMIRGDGADAEAWLIDTDGVAADRRPRGSGYLRCIARLADSLRGYPRVGRTDLVRGIAALAGPDRAQRRTLWQALTEEVAARSTRRTARRDGARLADYA